MTAAASSLATTKSASPAVSRQRRSDPASSSRSTAGWRDRYAPSGSTSSSASTRRTRSSRRSQRSIPSTIFCCVFGPNPLTSVSRPSAQAAFSATTLSIPIACHSCWIFFRLSPGTSASSSAPGGRSLRSRSSCSERPVDQISAIVAASAGPIPDTSVSRLSSTSAPSSSRSSSTARAPVSYARARNLFSPLSSRRRPISRKARATASLSITFVM
jgi:hypothetical protein